MGRTKKERIIDIIKSIAVILVLHARLVIIEVPGDECFSNFGLIDVIGFVGIYCILDWLRKKHTNNGKRLLFLSFVFAVTYVMTKTVMIYMSLVFFVILGWQFIWMLLCVAGYWLLFYTLVESAVVIIEDNCYVSRSNEKMNFDKHPILFHALIILLCWAPWLVLNYPGTVCIDASEEIRQVLGIIPYDAKHPILSVVIMGGLASFGKSIGNGNLGLFLYEMLQAVCGAIIFAYGVAKLAEMRLARKYCNSILVFFALCPLWGSAVQWFEKDLLYTEFATLFLILLFDIVRNRKVGLSQMVVLVIVSILVSMLRNNGVYAVIPTLFCLFILLKNKNKVYILISMFLIIGVFMVMNRFVYPMVGVEKGTVREALSIPFQQTARYLKEHWDEVTNDEYEAISAVLDPEVIAEDYNPVLSDAVKNTYKEDDSKLPEYFKQWFFMLFKHPRTYFEAAICKSYGYLAPVDSSLDNSIVITPYPDYMDGVQKIGAYHVFDEKMARPLLLAKEWLGNMPLVKYLSMTGFYSWLLLLVVWMLIAKRKWSVLITTVPLIMNLLVCIASPCSNEMAYFLSDAAGIPFVVGILLVTVSCDNEILERI